MSTTHTPAATTTEVPLSVTFHVRDDATTALLAKAAEVDDAQNGEHLREYTVPQALSVVWHAEPEWLHAHVLCGWVVDSPLGWPEGGEWVTAASE